MISISDLKLYFKSAAKRLSQLELADLLCDIAIILFYPIVACKGAWYLLTIVILADIFRFLVRGAWYYAPFHSTAHWHNPSKDAAADFVACTKVVFLVVLLFIKLPELFLKDIPYLILLTRSWIWYVIAITTITETFRCLLHTMHKYNADWLSGTSGRIGIPNWISIARISASIIMPHIYMTQSLGRNSSLIATILMILAICTDAVDGFIARRTNSITKVGKYLDPLGDKVIFFPNAVAFIWMLYRQSQIVGSISIFAITAFFIAVSVGRDVLFFVWFFKQGRKIPKGVGASLVDKIRMAAICGWLLSTAIALSTPANSTDSRMTAVSVLLIVCVAVLSVFSIHVDYERLKNFAQK